MASRSFQFYMTPEEYWGAVWPVISERFIVVRRTPQTPEAIPLEYGAVPNSGLIGAYMAFPSTVETGQLKAALKEPAKYGGISLLSPATSDTMMIWGSVGIKNHWYEGEIYYEKKESLDDYKLFHRPLNKLIVGWTEIIRDLDGSRSPHKGIRCSRGAVEWVENGGVLKGNKKDPDHFVPLWDSLKKPRKSE